MAIDFTKYQPPGVYVKDTTGGVATRRFSRGTTIALVGWASGVRVATEQVSLAGETESVLSYTDAQEGAVVVGRDDGRTFTEGEDYTEVVAEGEMSIARIVSSGEDEVVVLEGTIAVQLENPYYLDGAPVVRSAAAGGGTLYDEDDDYVIDYDNGTIVRTADSTIPNGGSVYVTYDYCAIRDGGIVSVTYSYSDSQYYEVSRHDSFETVRDVYGEPFDGDGVIISQLSFAAYLAFLNGAESIYCVATEHEDEATNVDYIAAMNKLKAYDDIDYVIPLSGNEVVHANAASHATEMAANSAERRFILGADGSSVVVPSATLQSRAASLVNERVILTSPSSVLYYNVYSNSIDTLPAYYLAAALGGVASAVSPYQSLTYRQVQGFYKLAETRSKVAKMEEARNGLCVVEESNGALRIYHGVTTNPDSVLTRENSVVFSKDRMMQMLRGAFSSSVIGQPILEDTVYIVKTLVTGVLDSAQRSGYIYSYGDVEARQNTSNPTMIEVRFLYKPTYPLNYVYISFAVDLESGEIAA